MPAYEVAPIWLDATLVRETGLEPVRCEPHAPQTCASASSATLAYCRFDNGIDYTRFRRNCQGVLQKFFGIFQNSSARSDSPSLGLLREYGFPSSLLSFFLPALLFFCLFFYFLLLFTQMTHDPALPLSQYVCFAPCMREESFLHYFIYGIVWYRHRMRTHFNCAQCTYCRLCN